MSDQDSDEEPRAPAEVVRFPQSRTAPPASVGGFKDLGIGAMARHLNMPKSQMTGHWCSRCNGIWFGYALEVECPQCGNRHG
jgi:hypothetical protein